MTSNLLLYQTQDGKTRLEVHLKEETVWLPLTGMSDLFQLAKPDISCLIYKEGELEQNVTAHKFAKLTPNDRC